MKELVGKEISVVYSDEQKKIRGIMLENHSDYIVIQDKEYTAYIPKKHIVTIAVKNDAVKTVMDKSGMILLSIVEKNVGKETGMFYITDEDDVDGNIETLLKNENIDSNKHAVTVVGDLFEIPNERLKMILGNLMVDISGE